ncbi:hypothetical protein OF83DRAFT_1292220 [Amylostereum chailletii]|nr:hypothetical protein OF83DRAFT_1292220 [Amylostereum chailletii]
MASAASSPSTYTPRHVRALSPPLSAATGSTVGPQMQRLNIVTRLAIEGHAKKGDSVTIKMYLKLALPADNITPGSAIPLFKEEDVKILDSEVHPLDHSSSPYNFSSSASPLLHNAARALNLPARLPHSYLTLFGQQSSTSSRYASSSSSKDPESPRLDEKYTGHILVSGYQVSFVLPKEFPPKPRANGRHDENGDFTPLQSKFRSRRGSVGEKNVILFMAGIKMIVPYLSKPPRAPWLLSIPTPRCLSNNLKLHIFSPNAPPSNSSSFQSLSSNDGDSDAPSWDMTADPHVTRSSSTSRRSTYQYQHFADDESSDSASAPGFADGVGIQGSFPSTERVRVRWAAPVRSVDDGIHDGRRRVGVEDVRGEMMCTVLGRGRERRGEREGIVMHLEYKGSCQGVWFPGVATLLGMDIGLEAKGCDVCWARGHEAKWDIIGGTGYTGHEWGGSDEVRVVERQSSFEMPQLVVSSDSPSAGPSNGHVSSSASSTASLLRAPLPSQNVPEYSFESAPTTPSDTGISSMMSTDADSKGRSRASSLAERDTEPSSPITLHLNINDLLPPNTNPFTFTLSGTVLVAPRKSGPPPSPPSSDRDDIEDLAVVFPRFRVLAADAERIETTVRNNVETSTETLAVHASSDLKARGTELTRGGRTRLGPEGGRAVLQARPTTRGMRSVSPFPNARREDSDSQSLPPSRARSPNLQRIASSSALRETLLTSIRPRRDGDLMIPYVDATVSPLSTTGTGSVDSYAVRVVLPAPADSESEWLEFFLAQPASTPSTSDAANADTTGPPRVEIVAASLEGVPVKCETSAAAKPDKSTMSALAFEQMSGQEWITWVRIHVGAIPGGIVEVIYVVKREKAQGEKGQRKTKGKNRADETSNLLVILPTFGHPIGRVQIDIECPSDFVLYSLNSNLTHQQPLFKGRRLHQYSVGEFFYPLLRIDLHPVNTKTSWLPTSVSKLARFAYSTATILSVLILLFFVLGMNNELGRLRNAIGTCAAYQGYDGDTSPPVVTVTATVLSQDPWPSASATVSTAGGGGEDHEPTVTVIDVTSPSSQLKEGKSVHSEQYALLAIRQLPFQWPIHFEVPFTTQQAVDTVLDGLGVAWQILRKLYHYPLPPP